MDQFYTFYVDLGKDIEQLKEEATPYNREILIPKMKDDLKLVRRWQYTTYIDNYIINKHISPKNATIFEGVFRYKGTSLYS